MSRVFLLLALLPLLAACSHSNDRDEGEADEEGRGRGAWELRLLRDPTTGRIPDGIDRAERLFAAALDQNSDRRALSSASIWPTNGRLTSPVGGRTRALGLDVRRGDTVIAGGVSGGMWRSSDSGKTWIRTTQPDSFPASSCLVQDVRPGHEDTWYAGTGEIVGGSAGAPGAYYLGDGLFKSTDNGRSWNRLSATVSNTPHTFDRLTDFVWDVAVDPSNHDTSEVYAATYGAIMRSINGGTTWSNVRSTNNVYSPYTDVAVTDSGVVYATLSRGGAQHGIWRSLNGTVWTRITPSDWPDRVNRVVIGISRSNPNIVYFLGETPGAGHLGFDFRKDSLWASLWRYDAAADSAQRWTNLSANLPSFGGSFGDFNPQGSYNLHIEVDPRDENIVYIGGTNLYRSSNGFRSSDSTRWIAGYTSVDLDSLPVQAYDYPHHHPDQHILVFAPGDPDRIYTGSDGGIHTADLSNWKFNTSDTVRWEPLNRSYKTGQFYTVALEWGTDMVAGGLQDNGTWMTTRGNDTVWKNVGSADGAYCAFASDGVARDLYVSKQQGRIYRLLLDGADSVESWTRVDPFGPGRDDYDFVNPFVVDPQGTRMYLPIGRVLWRNNDLRSIPLGSTAPAVAGWERLDSIRDPRGGIFSAITLRREVMGGMGSGALWLGTDSGSVLRIDDPTSATPTVQAVTGATMPRNGNVNCIWVDPTDTSRVVVVFSNYGVLSLWITRDNGANWESIGGNLEQSPNGTGNGPSCRWFTSIGPLGQPQEFVVATSTGVYTTQSLQGMSTVWTRVDLGGVRNVPVSMIADNGLEVVVATHGNGMYIAPYFSLGVDRSTDAARSGSVKVVPNPAWDGHGEAHIDFSGTTESEAVMEVVDMRGKLHLRRIVPLVNGRATVTFESEQGANAVLPGTYRLIVHVGERTAGATIKIVR